MDGMPFQYIRIPQSVLARECPGADIARGISHGKAQRPHRDVASLDGSESTKRVVTLAVTAAQPRHDSVSRSSADVTGEYEVAT